MIGKDLTVKEAALGVVEESSRFRAAVREGIAEAEGGNLIDNVIVLEWLNQQERR